MGVGYRREGDVALLELAHPPVNAFNLDTRRALVDAFTRLRTEPEIAAIVILGSGRGFSAGGDRREFGRPEASLRPTLSRDVLTAIATCDKPVVAAMHGFAVGGGLEFALACHARVAVATTQIGLPEVGLGRFPLSGSQRLPRLVGLECAAEWMMTGRMSVASDLQVAPIFDLLVADTEELMPAALECARTACRVAPALVDDRPFLENDPVAVVEVIEARYPAEQRSAAQHALLRALRAGVLATNFTTGLQQAQRLFDELVAESGSTQ